MKQALLIIACLLTGCVSIPKESAELSTNLGIKISEAKKAQFAIIDQYVEAKRAHIDDYMKYAWTPRFIRNFMKKINFKKAVCKLVGEMDQALEMQEIVQAISKKVLERRLFLLNELQNVEYDLKDRAWNHYSNLELINNTLTSNIKSVIKVKELRNQVLDALGAPMNNTKGLEEANGRMNKLLD